MRVVVFFAGSLAAFFAFVSSVFSSLEEAAFFAAGFLAAFGAAWASGSAFLPQKDFTVYAASKAYVYSFGRALGKELKKQGISVTVVCPGPVETPFLSHAYGRYGEMSFFKKMATAKPDRVVRKALKDCKRGKEVSLYGLSMNILYGLTRGLIR